MSSAERFVRHHRRQTDRAISQAYARLATNSLSLAAFTELLNCVRKQATRVLDAPVVDGQHLGIEALINLSRFASAHVRPIADWTGSEASWHVTIASLAQHLVGKYSVPRFLAASWYASDACAERKRQWFVAHAAGASFRSLELPMQMTRRMEDIFLASKDHLDIANAMRRAELLGLGVPEQLAQAVLATGLAADLRNSEFWRTVWLFLVTHARVIDPAQVGPIVDFVQSIRHERVTVETARGLLVREPPQPLFSMKGRTVRSMLRMMQEWHQSLGVASGGLTWEPSPLRPMMIEEPGQDPFAPPTIWYLMELTNAAALRTEGAALRHCVGSYADRCWRGASRIWSLRMRRADKVRHVLTIEVHMPTRALIQARGWRNQRAFGKPLRLLQEWTVREKLRLAI